MFGFAGSWRAAGPPPGATSVRTTGLRRWSSRRGSRGSVWGLAPNGPPRSGQAGRGPGGVADRRCAASMPAAATETSTPAAGRAEAQRFDSGSGYYGMVGGGGSVGRCSRNSRLQVNFNAPRSVGLTARKRKPLRRSSMLRAFALAVEGHGRTGNQAESGETAQAREPISGCFRGPADRAGGRMSRGHCGQWGSGCAR